MKTIKNLIFGLYIGIFGLFYSMLFFTDLVIAFLLVDLAIVVSIVAILKTSKK